MHDEKDLPQGGDKTWPIKSAGKIYWVAKSRRAGILKKLFLSEAEAWDAADELDDLLAEKEASLNGEHWTAFVVRAPEGSEFIVLSNDKSGVILPTTDRYRPSDESVMSRIAEVINSLDEQTAGAAPDPRSF